MDLHHNLSIEDREEINFATWLLFVNENGASKQNRIPERGYRYFDDHLWKYLSAGKNTPIFEEFTLSFLLEVGGKDVIHSLMKIGVNVKCLEIWNEVVHSELAFKYMPNIEELYVRCALMQKESRSEITENEHFIRILEENKSLKKLHIFIQNIPFEIFFEKLLSKLTKVSSLEELHFKRLIHKEKIRKVHIGNLDKFLSIGKNEKCSRIFPQLTLFI